MKWEHSSIEKQGWCCNHLILVRELKSCSFLAKSKMMKIKIGKVSLQTLQIKSTSSTKRQRLTSRLESISCEQKLTNKSSPHKRRWSNMSSSKSVASVNRWTWSKKIWKDREQWLKNLLKNISKMIKRKVINEKLMKKLCLMFKKKMFWKIW